ncbi:MAG: ATP-dependent DNA helicase RecG [Lachnospiraceae bacterium]|nr:ATP-dependent DNA helicase RecG [Lachnospiraceae bacterium]
MLFSDNVNVLKGVGEKNAALLKKLGIENIGDLLRYYPRAYEIYAMPQGINELREGDIASIECVVSVRPEVLRIKGKTIINLRVNDPTGSLKLVWYNAPFIVKQIFTGKRYIFRGKVARSRGELIIAMPQMFSREEYLVKMSGLWPVYPLTKGVTNNLLTKIISAAYKDIDDSELKDYVKRTDLTRLGIISNKQALAGIHFPKTKEEFAEARRRLVFDEFTGFMASVRNLRENRVRQENTHKVTDFSIFEDIKNSLTFELTGAQEKVLEEMKKDFSGKYAASRMIQGDVGSGKTIVAIMALAAFAKAGMQGCIMAPTDVLARQHYESFSKILEPFGIKCVLLTGSMTAAAKKKCYAEIKEHKVDIIIGTHAVIQEKVEYADLGLAVIDEQHRFGVKQREALGMKSNAPHIVVMSATPIPRSLAIMLYGDLDLSIIDEMPKDRLPIKNCVVDTGYRSTAYKFIAKQVGEGRQAYVICPMIDENDEIEAENVLEYTENLRRSLNSICVDKGSSQKKNEKQNSEINTGHGSAQISVEFLHGRMKAAEKADIMERFGAGEIDVLVSTTVIEVGVNVANATVMMVENAERFGLAQLHQLRGRVGRGNAQSYCIFIKGMGGKDIDERLNILVKYNNGMKVAEEDLKLRGPGDFFGTRQSGDLKFTLSDIYGDADVLKIATDYVNGLDKKEFESLCSFHIQTNSLTI